MNRVTQAARTDDPDVRLLSAVSAAARLAIGTGLALAPGLTLGALGFTERSGPTRTVARIAASRDIVLGLATAAALNDPIALRRASLANALADGGDCLSFLAALSDPAQRAAAARGLAAAIPATLAGLWVATRLTGHSEPVGEG